MKSNELYEIEDEKNITIENSPLKKKKDPLKEELKKLEISDLKIQERKGIKKVIQAKLKMGVDEQEVFSIKFDPEDTYLATGVTDGEIRIFNLHTGKLQYTMQGSSSGCPTTALRLYIFKISNFRWRPHSFSSKTKNILISGNSDGTVIHWHATSTKAIHEFVEKDNAVLALDITKDGNYFATAGKDCKLRIYDEETQSIIIEMKKIEFQNAGHSNRIFALKFIPDDPNVIMSAGSDRNVHIWDMRVKKSVAAIFGPNIIGDALDFKNNQILTGSYKATENLRVYDYGTQKLLYDIDWDSKKKNVGAFIYSAQFSKSGDDTLLVGTGGLNEVQIFDPKNEYKPFCKISEIQKSVYCVDHGQTVSKFAFATAGGAVYVGSITPTI